MMLHTSLLLSLLASTAIGRPSTMDEGDPLPQSSRVTAFVIDQNGNPSVECWELSYLANDMTIKRKDGSKATARSLQIAASGDLDGVGILTWPSYSPIWPDPDSIEDDAIKSSWLDLSNTFNLFNIQGGLINFKFSIFGARDDDDDDWPDHTFSLENGDDWFYFEDRYTGSDSAMRVDAAPFPMQVSSVSGTETEAMRLRFNKRPTHKVLHKGGCSFTGISTPAEPSLKRKSHRQSLVKQQNAEL